MRISIVINLHHFYGDEANIEHFVLLCIPARLAPAALFL